MSATPTPAPRSIVTYETEAAYQHPDLDLSYIDALAADLAAILADGRPAEAAYQPGDGTRYNVVIVPLSALRAGQPRVHKGQVWERHAVVGMKARGGVDGGDGGEFYSSGGYLLALIDGPDRCYPITLSGGEKSGIAAGYVHAQWNLSPVSAVSVALLLRAICVYLEAAEVPAGCTGYRDPESASIQHDGDTCPIHEG